MMMSSGRRRKRKRVCGSGNISGIRKGARADAPAQREQSAMPHSASKGAARTVCRTLLRPQLGISLPLQRLSELFHYTRPPLHFVHYFLGEAQLRVPAAQSRTRVRGNARRHTKDLRGK